MLNVYLCKTEQHSLTGRLWLHTSVLWSPSGIEAPLPSPVVFRGVPLLGHLHWRVRSQVANFQRIKVMYKVWKLHPVNQTRRKCRLSDPIIPLYPQEVHELLEQEDMRTILKDSFMEIWKHKMIHVLKNYIQSLKADSLVQSTIVNKISYQNSPSSLNTSPIFSLSDSGILFHSRDLNKWKTIVTINLPS